MKKKIIGLLLAVVVAFSSLWMGCGGIKDDPNTLEISIYNGGWGLDWINAAKENFEAQHDNITVEINSQDLLGQIGNQIKAGPEINSVDLYFASEDIFGLLLNGSNTLAGYNMVFEPLDEIYDYKPDGVKTIREKCTDGLIEAVTFETTENGQEVSHEYVMHFGDSASGIVYNETKFNQLGITLPRTTDELYDVTCKQISEKFSNDNLTHAAFSESIKTAYSQYMFNVWWAQYEGYEGVKNFCNGIYYKDGIKKYGSEIFKQKGRLYALEAYEKMIGPEYKNAHTNINSMQSIQAQQQFMQGNCLMMVNGNWLENEMKIRTTTSGFTDVIKMMKSPIISKIVEKTPSIVEVARATSKTNDEVLREVVSFVDGQGSKPDGVTDEDIKIISDARNIRYCNYSGGTCIPAYSNAKDIAKEFLKYICSAEFAQIYFEKTGNFIAFNKDLTNLENASTFMKSVADTQGNIECPNPYRYELECLGGMLNFPGTVNIPSLFAAKNSADRKTPQEIFDKAIAMGTDEYFNTVLQTAGLI